MHPTEADELTPRKRLEEIADILAGGTDRSTSCLIRSHSLSRVRIATVLSASDKMQSVSSYAIPQPKKMTGFAIASISTVLEMTNAPAPAGPKCGAGPCVALEGVSDCEY
jgi:hypothetical protein